MEERDVGHNVEQSVKYSESGTTAAIMHAFLYLFMRLPCREQMFLPVHYWAVFGGLHTSSSVLVAYP